MQSDTVQPNVDKWTPFLLSLLLPGSGQLLVGSWSAVPWLAATGTLAALGAAMSGIGVVGVTAIQVGSLALLSICSAEHAKRLLETRSARPHAIARPRVRYQRKARRNVRVQIVLDLRLPVDALWKRVSDLTSFLTIDPFHQQITLLGDRPARGADLVLHHNIFGIRLKRFGRLLRWQAGQGYTFSDLSGRDPRRGFPHVFMIDVTALDSSLDSLDEQSRLTITVCGKWTAWLPLCVGRWWLWAVCAEHGRLLRKAM